MRPFAGTWAVALLAIGVGTGCADEQEALIVVRSVFPSAEMDDTSTSCTWPDDNSSLRSGELDVAVGGAYTLAPELFNNLQARGTSTNSGVDDSELRLDPTVDITLNLPGYVADAMALGPDGQALPLSYGATIASDSLAPGSSFVPLVKVIPFEHSTALASAIAPGEKAQVSVDLVFHATRTGNSRGNVGVIDSRAYRFPIELCNGCMLNSCLCDGGDECVPDTEVYLGLCFVGQDASLTNPASCSSALPPLGTTTGDDMTTSDDGGGSSMGSG